MWPYCFTAEIDLCLESNGGCHANAECVKTGPRKVSNHTECQGNVIMKCVTGVSFSQMQSFLWQCSASGLLPSTQNVAWEGLKKLAASLKADTFFWPEAGGTLSL